MHTRGSSTLYIELLQLKIFFGVCFQRDRYIERYFTNSKHKFVGGGGVFLCVCVFF